MAEIRKSVKGWAIRQPNGRLRTYGFTDALGMIAQQVSMWPTKRMAKSMCMSKKGETPVRVVATFHV